MLPALFTSARRCSTPFLRAVAITGAKGTAAARDAGVLGSAFQRKASTSAEETAADKACIDLYFTGTEPQENHLHVARVQEVPGKGRGLVAARALAPGDLVLLAQPLAVLHGPQDAMPAPDALLAHLRTAWPGLSPALRQQLAALHGAQRAAGAAGDPAAGAAGAAAASAGAGRADAAVDLEAVVSYNAYGDEYEDLPAARLRASAAAAPLAGGSGGGQAAAAAAEGVRSHVGLWGDFSLLNHSCAPNCVHYVVGATMVVRAVQAVPEGGELTISYLGRDDLAPQQVRQAVLRSRYGFACGCPRCRTEREELPAELQELLLELHERARSELAPRFERLAEAVAVAAAGGGDLPSDDEDDQGDDDADIDAGKEGAEHGGSGQPQSAAGLAGAAGSGGATAAEQAKRKLKEAAAAPSAAAAAAAAAAEGPRWTRMLAALEPRLEECARQLHLALKELQEDDEADEDAASASSTSSTTSTSAAPTTTSTSTSTAASAPAPPRRMTRVQVAQAAAYQLLELLQLHAHLVRSSRGGGGAGQPGGRGAGAGGGAADEAAAGSLLACWHVLDSISRGSELQVFQACRLLEDAMQAAAAGSPKGRQGSAGAAGSGGSGAGAALQQSGAVREAAALLGQSLLARYGRLRGQHLTRVTQAAILESRAFF